MDTVTTAATTTTTTTTRTERHHVTTIAKAPLQTRRFVRSFVSEKREKKAQTANEPVSTVVSS